MSRRDSSEVVDDGSPTPRMLTRNELKSRVLEHAHRQALAATKARELALALNDGELERGSEQSAEHWVELANALLASGRITASEHLIYATFGAEYVHEKRWLAGLYPEIEEISSQISELERAYGLNQNEYWPLGDEPEEITPLNAKFSAALDKRFEETLIEFGLYKLAELWNKNRNEYDRQREIGRRSIFEKHDKITAVSTSLQTYEREAENCAGAGAFYAAAVMLGSAAEARLLEAVLRYPKQTQLALEDMKRADKPRNSDPMHWSLEHLVAVAEQAGWISTIENDVVGARVGPWLSSLRNLRNLLHPGRHVRDKPHAIIGREEYTDAQFGYDALCISLSANLPDTEPV